MKNKIILFLITFICFFSFKTGVFAEEFNIDVYAHKNGNLYLNEDYGIFTTKIDNIFNDDLSFTFSSNISNYNDYFYLYNFELEQYLFVYAPNLNHYPILKIEENQFKLMNDNYEYLERGYFEYVLFSKNEASLPTDISRKSYVYNNFEYPIYFYYLSTFSDYRKYDFFTNENWKFINSNFNEVYINGELQVPYVAPTDDDKNPDLEIAIDYISTTSSRLFENDLFKFYVGIIIISIIIVIISKLFMRIL